MKTTLLQNKSFWTRLSVAGILLLALPLAGIAGAEDSQSARRSYYRCGQLPSFDSVTASQSAIKAKNNASVSVVFSGRVDFGAGCEPMGAWYSVTDEYGELSRTADLQLGRDGSFTATVEVLASRKGDDKDGRTYTVQFSAANQAGKSGSEPVAITVSHDNRK